MDYVEWKGEADKEQVCSKPSPQKPITSTNKTCREICEIQWYTYKKIEQHDNKLIENAKSWSLHTYEQ